MLSIVVQNQDTFRSHSWRLPYISSMFLSAWRSSQLVSWMIASSKNGRISLLCSADAICSSELAEWENRMMRHKVEKNINWRPPNAGFGGLCKSWFKIRGGFMFSFLKQSFLPYSQFDTYKRSEMTPLPIVPE